jgi:hydroxyacylglutathione hydrolase
VCHAPANPLVGSGKLEVVLITGFPTGVLACNCYVVARERGGEAFVVDPGQSAMGRLRRVLDEHDLTPKSVLLTHGHIDHIWSARQVSDHTPGHTRGSVTFRITAETGVGDQTGPVDVVFSGDTLFQGSVGRTDLPGGSGRDLLGSIVAKLLVLDDDTVVLPGHGDSTTIGAERRTNPFLEGLS